MGLLTLLTLGFFLGMRHATDSDHVVAVTTIVSRERSVRAASLIGALWGIGHTLTIMLVGGAIILFGIVFPARVGLTMEFSVALMLVVLGAMNVIGFRQDVRQIRDSHVHPRRSSAPPPHEPHEGSDAHSGGASRRLGHYRALVVGTVHGLAGSAAVALLVLSTIRNAAWALLYLFLFGIGTVAGMMLITSALAAPLVYSARRFSTWNRHVSWVTGVISVVLGLFLVYQIGFVDGLFGATPHWDPH
jgi:high-affinity nickel-transport protein